MAILASDSCGYIICHETYINDIYRKTKRNEDYFAFTINPAFFSMFAQFRNNKNRRVDSDELDSEVKLILTAHERLLKLYEARTLITEENSHDNVDAKAAANKFYSTGIQYPERPFSGGNKEDFALVAEVNSRSYIFPKNCKFYSCDVKDINRYLQNRTFQFILMDPPWWNKFIRRKRKANAMSCYAMLHNSNLMNLPVGNLLDADGLLGIWCTSAPSHIKSILTELFPAWNMEFVSQWYWLKVTKHGEPICAFSSKLGKQPYERIIFGKKKNSVRKYMNPENEKIIMSVPSAIHSHKPPLCELMKPFLPENGDCLELFARYLLPNWTSYGNEVVKLQNSSLYEEVLDVTDPKE